MCWFAQVFFSLTNLQSTLPKLFMVEAEESAKLRALRALAARVSFPICSRVLRVSCSPASLAPYPTCSRVSRVSCPTCSHASRNSYLTYSTVNHYDMQLLLTECYYNGFFLK